jgi:hypothetical protein
MIGVDPAYKGSWNIYVKEAVQILSNDIVYKLWEGSSDLGRQT